MMRTKIVCTLGPACDDEHTLREMVRAGMSIARINFSHGATEDHARRIALARRVASLEGVPITLMGDLQGPKFRIGQLVGGPLTLTVGAEVVLSANIRDGVVPFPHSEVLAVLQEGQRLLIDDGAMALRTRRRLDEHTIACEVLVGGVLSSNKGVSVPGVPVRISAITEKDRADLAFAIEQQVDAIAMSFVRSADDVLALRALAREMGGDPLIVAKIEKPEAMAHLSEIVMASDALMVARGDLGVEGTPEDVPFFQKQIIQACLRAGKPVITATQMLQSMIHAPHPTRAEASDVANAVLDGSDAVMLSGETAIGRYPVEATQTMARLAARAEAQAAARISHTPSDADVTDADRRTDAITSAAVEIAEQTGAKAIVCVSSSGFTARMVARHRPTVPVVCLTPHARTQSYCAFMWGVRAVVTETRHVDTETLLACAARSACQFGYACRGDWVVVTAGLPLGSGSGHTNMIRLLQVE